MLLICFSSIFQVETDGGVQCRNPWHDKWGGCDTQFKYPSQVPKMAQFIFQLLGYEPANNRNKKRARFCATCISRANSLTVDEFKDLEAQAKQKWVNVTICIRNIFLFPFSQCYFELCFFLL